MLQNYDILRFTSMCKRKVKQANFRKSTENKKYEKKFIFRLPGFFCREIS